MERTDKTELTLPTAAVPGLTGPARAARQFASIQRAVPLSRLAEKIFDQPLMIHPSKLNAILQGLGSRILGQNVPGLPQGLLDLFPREAAEASAAHFAFDDDDYGGGYRPAEKRPYRITDTGVAVIPVQGTLIKKASGMWGFSGCSSYDSIGKAIQAAVDDDAVRGIMLDIDSPGGETHGAFELSDLIYSLRGEKPLYAAANDLAASAAYAIASACDKVFVTRTGAVGSIGVYSLHMDQSGADEQYGVKYTYIYAGDKKVDGNPHEPLSRTAKNDSQKEVDRQYGIFVDTVARNRSKKADSVISTQAACFFAERAVPLLADAVGTIDDAMAELEAEIGVSPKTSTSNSGTGKGKTPMRKNAASESNVIDISAASEEQLVAALAALKATKNEAEDPADKKEAKKGAKSGDADYSGKDDESDKKAAAAAEPDDDEDDDKPKDDEKDAKKSKAAAPAASPAAAKSGRSVAAEVAELCTLAGVPQATAEFILELEAGVTDLAKIRATLLDQRAKASLETSVNGYTGPVGVSALDNLEQAATSIAANSGGKISKARALEQAMLKNPSLYSQYRTERNSAVAVPNSPQAERYMSMLGQRYPSGVLGGRQA